jgi:hypothetical protein
VTHPKVGRPAHVPTDDSRKLVESLSGFGIPQDEIARLVGIDPKTLRFHYADQIELGGIKATAKVAQNLFTMACKPTREGLSAAIFWLKVRAGWSEYAPRARSRPSRWARRQPPKREALTAGEGTASGAAWSTDMEPWNRCAVPDWRERIRMGRSLLARICRTSNRGPGPSARSRSSTSCGCPM